MHLFKIIASLSMAAVASAQLNGREGAKGGLRKRSPCKVARATADALKLKLGAFRPKCDDDGEYSKKQCHESTGICWCVNSEGVKIGEPVRRRDSQLDCSDFTDNGGKGGKGRKGGKSGLSTRSPCQVARDTAAPKLLRGAFVPKCDADGEYSKKQCHVPTELCWCVNSEGVKIGEKFRKGSNQRC